MVKKQRWHMKPKSWSVLARELADRFYSWEDKEKAIEDLKNSYRPDIIKHRAIKRFVRKQKRGDII